MDDSSEGLQRFAVILDNATSLVHGRFFRRPTRKIMILLQVCHPKEQAARINIIATGPTRKITVPLKRGTPRSRLLGSTSLQPAVRDGRGCRTGAMRTFENSSFPGTSVKVGLEGGRCVYRTPPGAKCQVPSCVRHD